VRYFADDVAAKPVVDRRAAIRFANRRGGAAKVLEERSEDHDRGSQYTPRIDDDWRGPATAFRRIKTKSAIT
jgi:hypothetical protein